MLAQAYDKVLASGPERRPIMDGNPEDLFRYMEAFFKTWLEGARHRGIPRLLELVREELARHGYTLTYEVKGRRA